MQIFTKNGQEVEITEVSGPRDDVFFDAIYVETGESVTAEDHEYIYENYVEYLDMLREQNVFRRIFG